MRVVLTVLLATFVYTSVPAADLIDINVASQDELETINGVGPRKAQAIIEYRAKHGGFKSVDELDQVPGFGAKSIEKMRAQITVTGAGKASSSLAEEAPAYDFIKGHLEWEDKKRDEPK